MRIKISHNTLLELLTHTSFRGYKTSYPLTDFTEKLKVTSLENIKYVEFSTSTYEYINMEFNSKAYTFVLC